MCAWLATSVKGIRRGSGWIHYAVQKPCMPWFLTLPSLSTEILRNLSEKPWLWHHLQKYWCLNSTKISTSEDCHPKVTDIYYRRKKLKCWKWNLPKFFAKMSQPPFPFLLTLHIVVGGWSTVWTLGFYNVLLISKTLPLPCFCPSVIMWRNDAEVQVSSKCDACQLYQEGTAYRHPRRAISIFRVI